MSLSNLSKRRLTTLIKFMEGLPKEARKHFSMRWWVGHNGDGEVIGHHGIKTGAEINQKKLLIECGLAACAFGWAAVIPSFKKAGLKLQKRNEIILAPVYEGVKNQDAAKKFFDLDADQADALFAPDVQVSTPLQWANLARRKLAMWEKK